MSTGTRYVIIGAGAIGGLLAAQFELAGISSVLVARGRHLDVIRERGLTIRRPHVTQTVPVAVVAGPHELTLTHQDVLVLATKAQDAEAALAEWAWQPVPGGSDDALLGADLPILTFQNGLAAEDIALRRFSRVYGVMIGVAASYLVPGEVVSPSFPLIGIAWLGRYPGSAEHAIDGSTDVDQERFVADLVRAGYATRSVTDIGAWKARKLLANVANGLDVLAGTDDERAAARQLVVDEAVAVFGAAGIRAAENDPGHFSQLKIEPVPGHTAGHASTWQSFARGASSEVDYLNGEIVRLGRLHGVPVPVNELLQRWLGAQAAAGQGPGVHRLADLLAATTAGARAGAHVSASVGGP